MLTKTMFGNLYIVSIIVVRIWSIESVGCSGNFKPFSDFEDNLAHKDDKVKPEPDTVKLEVHNRVHEHTRNDLFTAHVRKQVERHQEEIKKKILGDDVVENGKRKRRLPDYAQALYKALQDQDQKQIQHAMAPVKDIPTIRTRKGLFSK